MSNSFRSDLSSAIVSLCPASFGANIWLFFYYFSSRPKEPQRELGLVYPLNNHGSHVYVSKVETTGLSLLMIAFFLGLLLAIAIVPKEPSLPPAWMPRWMTYVSFSTKTTWNEPTPRMWGIFFLSFSFYLLIIVFAGRSIIDFAISLGAAMHWE
jgi:hypothetical protein